MIQVLVILFRLLLSNGKLPTEWKTAHVIPKHKKGSRIDCTNYLPISLTCCLCKGCCLFERLLKTSLLQYISDNNLLSDTQYGFLPRRSCMTALVSYLDHVSELIDNRNRVDSISLDFSKAFDSVPHHRLIIKLRDFGVSGNVLSWITSFLTNRQERVVVGDFL